jgi:hypothetical protein
MTPVLNAPGRADGIPMLDPHGTLFSALILVKVHHALRITLPQ